MLDVYAQADAYQEELLALDRDAAARITSAYRDVYDEARRRLQYYTLARARAIKALGEIDPKVGGVIGPGPAYRLTPFTAEQEKQIQALAAAEFQTRRWAEESLAIKQAMDRYAGIAQGITSDAQGAAIGLGVRQMNGLISTQMPDSIGWSFNRPDDQALRAMVGFTSTGAPLSDLFERLSIEAMGLAKQTLMTGITLGWQPDAIARQLAGPLGIPLWRGLTIARTETLRAYRTAQQQTIEDNADVLEGWTWRSARDPRTCEVCWANDGKTFPVTIAAGKAAASLADAKQRWVTPGGDYGIKEAAKAIVAGQNPTGQEAEDARKLLAALKAADPVPGEMYRGIQLANVPEKGSIFREPIGAWTQTLGNAEGYAEYPAGAAVYGKGQSGHQVVFVGSNLKAITIPEQEEYLSGGTFEVLSRRKSGGVWYLTVNQAKVYG